MFLSVVYRVRYRHHNRADASLLSLCLCTQTPPASASSCPVDGQWLYNTALVLDGMGSIAQRYHKAHLFAEAVCLDEGPVQPVTYVHVPFTEVWCLLRETC